ncbi:miraculin-like [Dorcoceras hygrometricum]|uniref:Miraculin-like n=1 Tax=Dorcoceras hygrometricum TaxID=472368 RepID=A0A2Z7ACG4_9LAMI|nr:miraculin-like [Dorcoceras hygrometricum]
MEIKRKPTIITIFIKLLYLSCPTFCQPPADSVRDVEGNELQTHIKYHIFSAGGGGGGLCLSARDHRYPCPHNVMQETNSSSTGLSVEIFPADHRQAIKLSADVNLAFLAATVCVQSTVWRVGGVDPFTGRRYVRSDGELGLAGGSRFKIARKGSGVGYYKMVHCPSPRGVDDTCEDVGVFVENNRRWLGLGGDTLFIVFKKVDPRSTDNKQSKISCLL